MTDDTKTLELSIELPTDLDWEELTKIEDECSEAVGDVLKEHGLERNEHTRRVEADYSGSD